jgi:ssDNA-binding Zn-finger/Zn-ribbon topoisomerase 1
VGTRPLDQAEPVPQEGKASRGAGLAAGPSSLHPPERRPDCSAAVHARRALPSGGVSWREEEPQGKIFYCTKWPECDFALWDKPVARPCPNGDSPIMVEKVTKSGTNLVCPKCRTKVAAEPASA